MLNGEELRRAYSICAAPGSGELSVAVKAIPGGRFSVFANTDLQVGDRLEVSPPTGRFILETRADKARHYLGLAAGSGITPLMAMLKAVLENEPDSTFTLVYGNKTAADTIFRASLASLEQQYPARFVLQYVLSRETNPPALSGRIDRSTLHHILQRRGKGTAFDEVFICGPEAMVDTARETLSDHGIDKAKIHFELFTASPSTANDAEPSFGGISELTVLLDGVETAFSTSADKTLLEASLDAGLDPPYSCQGGFCTSCLAKVTRGKATMPDSSSLSEAEQKEGFVLTCLAHPASNHIRLDFDDIS